VSDLRQTILCLEKAAKEATTSLEHKEIGHSSELNLLRGKLERETQKVSKSKEVVSGLKRYHLHLPYKHIFTAK
jgi:hypothetical protein